MFENIYSKRRVFITGHTGFKGSWLSLILDKFLSANICGYALPPENKSHFNLLDFKFQSHFADICSTELEKEIDKFQPEIIFHLAAQPLVRASYENPRNTFESNISGLVNLLEACRCVKSVKAIVIITSDKCYLNTSSQNEYTENAPLGGFDPYSASKACQEIIAASYRQSFFSNGPLLATVRAGNVIGGGDWAKDRLIPDLMNAAAAGTHSVLRNPESVRPWQHVLDPLFAYLLIGKLLLQEKEFAASAWNFGPDSKHVYTVRQIAEFMRSQWKQINFALADSPNGPSEAAYLSLDCSKAQSQLRWKPVWDTVKACEKTAAWHKEFCSSGKIISTTQISEFIECLKDTEWIN